MVICGVINSSFHKIKTTELLFPISKMSNKGMKNYS